MAERHKKRWRKGKGRVVGLTLFHAIGKMTVPPEPVGLPKGVDEAHERNSSLQTSNTAEELAKGNGAVEGRDVPDNGPKHDQTEEPEGNKCLPKMILNDLKVMRQGVIETYPLHFPPNAEHLITLLKKHPEMDPDTPNGLGDAAIHAIVRKKAHTKAERADKMTTLFNLLVYSNANVNAPAAYGMTALHMAANVCDVECAKVLLAFGARVNVKNVYQKTPLDLVEGPWHLLSRSDSNHASGSCHTDGNESFDKELIQTPSSALKEHIDLEYAPNKARAELIQILKSVGAERGRNMPSVPPAPLLQCPFVSELLSNAPDSSVVTIARQFFDKVMASSHSCEEAVKVLCSSDLEVTSNAVTLAKNAQKLIMLRKAGSRILCLDGGGMRALMQAEILAQIEAATGRKITEMFDWIVGTSMGGVLALVLVYGNTKSIYQLKQIGGKLPTRLFGKGLVGDVNVAEEMLKTFLPEDIKMCDVTYPRILVAAVNKSSRNPKLHFFNNCFNDEFSTQPVWKVARYTTAVPVLFSEKDNYVDGGLLANNPAMDAITHIQTYYRRETGYKLPISLVVSIGSGIQPEESLGSTILLKSSLISLLEVGRKAQNLVDLILACITESQRATDMCESHCKDMGIPYFRFNVPLEKKASMVIKDADGVVELLLRAREHMQDSPKLRELVLQLHDMASTMYKVYNTL